MEYNSIKLLIYMPALNEAETIYKVLKSIPTSYEHFNTLELLVINDGSTDNTESQAKAAGAKVINHIGNKGVGEAFQTALTYALNINATVMVSIDADGQFDVDQIYEFIQPIVKNEADFCIGNRFHGKRPENMPKLKYWGNKRVNKIVSFVSKTKIEDASCGFRAYSKEALLNLNLQGSFTYTHETILDLLDKGLSLKQIPVNVRYFDGRISRIADNIVAYALKTSIIIFKCLKDYKPLQFFLIISGIVFGLGFLLGGFTFIHWIVNKTISPYKSFGIIGLSLVGMSVIMAIFGFMADSLGRMRKNQERILYYLKKSYFEN